MPAVKVQKYLNNADIYVQASGYEGLPHVVLEAINHKLSIIATPIGGTNEILMDGKYGWVLPLVEGKKPRPEKIAEIINEILNNQIKDKAIKQSAYEMIETKFNEEKNLKKYLEYIV